MWVEGHWYYDPGLRALCHIPSGDQPETGLIEPDLTIPARVIPGLIETAMEQGLVTTKAQSRVEDLKIVHRLLDILDGGGE